jgi:signal recognition particle receptor subunit beta
VQFNPARRELTLKVVYYGPALSGKTTNLHALHQASDPNARGRLMTLDTADDRTLFFDLLPLALRTQGGVQVKIKLYTVPGQVIHNATRKIVLQNADAIAYIADAQPNARQANFDYWRNLSENLRENGLSIEEMPSVIQFNKCDLVDGPMADEIAEIQRTAREPVHYAIAIRQEGVVGTLMDLLSRTYDSLERDHDLTGRLGLRKDDLMRELSRVLVNTPFSAPLPRQSSRAHGPGDGVGP